MIYFSGNLYLCDVDVVLIVSDKCCPDWKVGAFYLENATFASKKQSFLYLFSEKLLFLLRNDVICKTK